MKLQHSAQTDVGKSRDVNQDSFKIGPQLPDGSQLFVVCDGMGGHLAGEVASQTAVETLVDTFPTSLPTDIPNALTQSFLAANQAVFERGRGNMGTTAVALLIYRNLAFIANVGDSRAYLFRNGELRQVSVDHSFVEEQVRAGLLTREQAARSHVRNIITRAVGHQRDVQVDVFREPVQAGDMFLLCSDGLHGYVEESVLADLLRRGPFNQIVPAMIKLANDAGGPDNITAIVVRVDELDAVDANDPLLAALLTQAPPAARETVELPLDDVNGPTGTAKMPVMRDDPPPPLAAGTPAPPAPPRERGLSLWGALGSLAVLALIFGGLYWFNLPPVSLLFGHTTATPALVATPRPALSTPTLVQTTPLTGTSTLSPTLSPAQRTLTPLGTPGASPTP
jgi:serine/threonine protein phosphatase PrpC